MRHRDDHKDLVVRIIGVLNQSARHCALYVVLLAAFTAVIAVLEIGVALDESWGLSLPLWSKIAGYATCFIGIIFAVMNAHYHANLLNRWGMYHPSEPIGRGEPVERPNWSLGRAIESAVRASAVYAGSNRGQVPLAQSLHRMTITAASAAGFAPAFVFMPDVARSGDPVVSALGLMLWMMFSYTMLRQGFATVGEDVDDMLAQQ